MPNGVTTNELTNKLQWSEEEKKQHYDIAKRNWSLWSELQRQNTQFPKLPPWPTECHTWEFEDVQAPPTATNIDLTVPVPVHVRVPDAVPIPIPSPLTLSGSKRKTTSLFTQNKLPTPGPGGFLASRFGLGKSSPDSLSETVAVASTSTTAAAVAAAASAAVACPPEFCNRPTTVRTLHLPASLVDQYAKNKQKQAEWCVSQGDGGPPIAFWLQDPAFQIVFDR